MYTWVNRYKKNMQVPHTVLSSGPNLHNHCGCMGSYAQYAYFAVCLAHVQRASVVSVGFRR